MHADPAYRHAAEDAFGELSGYIHTLNSNQRIFQHLQALAPPAVGGRGGRKEQGKGKEERLTVEEKILASDMLHELETEGEELRERESRIE